MRATANTDAKARASNSQPTSTIVRFGAMVSEASNVHSEPRAAFLRASDSTVLLACYG